jgi:hypothetical protein
MRIPFPALTERLPYDPFNTVPLHGTFDFSIDADPQPVAAEIILAINQGKPITMQTISLFINLFKLPSLSYQ